MVDRRIDVVVRLKSLEEAAAPLVTFLQNNLQMLTERYQIGPEQIEALYQYSKFQFESGNYSGAADFLYQYHALCTTADRSLQALWGKLAAEILIQNWDIALNELNCLKEIIDSNNFASSLNQVQSRIRLMHWSLFIFFNHDNGRTLIIDLFNQDKYLNAIQTDAPHLLRYLAIAFIVNKKRRPLLKEFIKVIQQEQHTFADPITEFLVCVYVIFDVDGAQKKMKECEDLIQNDPFLGKRVEEGNYTVVPLKDEFLENASLFIFETYCRIHERIDMGVLAEKLNLNYEDAERWILNLIRTSKLDVKIDSQTFCAVTPLPIDQETEKTVEKLKKHARLQNNLPNPKTSSTSIPPLINIWQDIPLPTDTEIDTDFKTEPSLSPPSSREPSPSQLSTHIIYQMAEPPPLPPPEQTLREWANYDVAQQPICITYPVMANFELRSGLINLLPIYRGVENEDPHKFLWEFHIVCYGMKPHNVIEDQIKLRAFPFALQDAAKDWLYYLPPGSVTTWNKLARSFLNNYFPEIKVSALRREIIEIKQSKRETFHTYWERFKRLCSRCPQHGITDHQLLQYFCEGMTPMERRFLNASSGGSIVDKTPTDIRALISSISEESKHSIQEEEWYIDDSRGVNEVNEVGTSHMETQISKLTKVVMLLARDKGVSPQVNACGECLQTGQTDLCPMLQEDTEQVKATNGYSGQQQRSSWGCNQVNNFQPRPPQNFQQRALSQQYPSRTPYQPHPSYHQSPPQQLTPELAGSLNGPSLSLEDLVKSLASSTMALQQETMTFQQETRASINNLKTQIAQLANSGKLEDKIDKGKISTHTENNTQHTACAITLRSGTSYENSSGHEKEKEVRVEKEKKGKEEKPTYDDIPKKSVRSVLFPSRLPTKKQEKEDREILDMKKRSGTSYENSSGHKKEKEVRAEKEKKEKEEKPTYDDIPKEPVRSVPFPSRLPTKKQEKEDQSKRKKTARSSTCSEKLRYEQLIDHTS